MRIHSPHNDCRSKAAKIKNTISERKRKYSLTPAGSAEPVHLAANCTPHPDWIHFDPGSRKFLVQPALGTAVRIFRGSPPCAFVISICIHCRGGPAQAAMYRVEGDLR